MTLKEVNEKAAYLKSLIKEKASLARKIRGSEGAVEEIANRYLRTLILPSNVPTRVSSYYSSTEILTDVRAKIQVKTRSKDDIVTYYSHYIKATTREKGNVCLYCMEEGYIDIEDVVSITIEEAE